MRIAVTGTNGQVARSLAHQGRQQQHDIVLVGRPLLDLAGSADAILAAIEGTKADVIVSAAAYTAVDRAESERELAFKVNEHGPGIIAKAAVRMGVPLVHLSTDYVFDGTKRDPYVEEDETRPRSVYGASKLAGEQAVLSAQPNSAVLRTAWVYSPFGSNFVKTMLRIGAMRDEVGVVADQIGNPTSARDIANAVITVASNLLSGGRHCQRGVFHLTAQGEASWAEFAAQVFDFSRQHGGRSVRVNPIASAEFPTEAPRPANSRLNSDKIRLVHGVQLPVWRSSLQAVIAALLGNASENEVHAK